MSQKQPQQQPIILPGWPSEEYWASEWQDQLRKLEDLAIERATKIVQGKS